MLHIINRRTQIEDIDAVQPPASHGWSATEGATLGIPPSLRRSPAIPVPSFVEHGIVSSKPEDVDAIIAPGSHGWHAVEDSAQCFPLEHCLVSFFRFL
jgi:hypothetical protein